MPDGPDQQRLLLVATTVWGFGEDRVVYGSNWPVCEKGGAYADEFKIVSEYFGAKGSGASEKYFWKNSLAAYRWIER